MTRKLRNRAFPIGISTLALIFAITGCGPDAKDQKISDLTAENDALKGELEERDRKLNDALVRQGDSQATIDELNQQLAKLRATKGREGEWVTMPSFDMLSVPGSGLF